MRLEGNPRSLCAQLFSSPSTCRRLHRLPQPLNLLFPLSAYPRRCPGSFRLTLCELPDVHFLLAALAHGRHSSGLLGIYCRVDQLHPHKLTSSSTSGRPVGISYILDPALSAAALYQPVPGSFLPRPPTPCCSPTSNDTCIYPTRVVCNYLPRSINSFSSEGHSHSIFSSFPPHSPDIPFAPVAPVQFAVVRSLAERILW